MHVTTITAVIATICEHTVAKFAIQALMAMRMEYANCKHTSLPCDAQLTNITVAVVISQAEPQASSGPGLW